MPTKPIFFSSDADLTPALANQMADLCGAMMQAAEAQPMPTRFDAVPHRDCPAMIVTHAVTGRAAIVPLHAYGSVRKALADLFGEG